MTRFFLPTLAVAVLLLSLPSTHAQTPPSAPVVVKRTLANGMRVLCKPETDTPLVAISVFVQTGAARETERTAGTGSLMARTLLLATTNRPPDTMARDIGALGGNLSTVWQPDWTQINALTVADRFDAAIDLLMDVLQNADFTSEAVSESVEDARQTLRGEAESADADLFQTAYAGARRGLYGGSDYALPPGGTAASLNAINRADLQRAWARRAVPKNIIIVVVGRVDADAAIEKIARQANEFSADKRTARRTDSAPAPPPMLESDPPPARVHLPDLTQAAVLVGFRAPPPASDDYPAFLLADTLLGGMKSGRLFVNVREKQGLVYETASALHPQQRVNDIIAYAYAAPTRANPQTKQEEPAVLTLQPLLLSQFDSLKAAPPAPDELMRAKHFLIGTDKIRHERIEDRAASLGRAELLRPDGWRFDTDFARFINAVTAQDVQRAAVRYFVHPVISTVEPDAAK